MTQMVQPRIITAPQVTARRGGLLDVAQVTDGIAWLEPTALYSHHNCLTEVTETAFICPTPEDEVPAKEFTQGPTWVDGIRFVGFEGFVCKGIGYDIDGSEEMASAAYLLDESRYVERRLMSYMAAEADTVSSGTTTTPRETIALLESEAAALYRGVPTLHLTVGLASRVAHDFEFRDGHFWTPLGSKVVVGAGYSSPNLGPGDDPEDPDNPSLAESHEEWVYATGEVVVGRGDLFARTEMNRETNEILTLAERAYVVSVECFIIAALAQTIEGDVA